MALTVSHRCQNIAPSVTLQIDARAKEMRAAGLDVIGFGAGEPDEAMIQTMYDAIPYDSYDRVIAVGEQVTVLQIQGVKLIVK